MKHWRFLRIQADRLEGLFKWLTGIGAVLAIVSALATPVSKVELGWFAPGAAFLKTFYIQTWLGAITFGAILLWIWTASLRRRFSRGFHDDFSKGLATNWDFVGGWRVTPNGELVVTNSDPGGLTKMGTFWENYTFEFEASIINQCVGIVVRAQDPNN